MTSHYCVTFTPEQRKETAENLYQQVLRLLDTIRNLDILKMRSSIDDRSVIDKALDELDLILDKVHREYHLLA